MADPAIILPLAQPSATWSHTRTSSACVRPPLEPSRRSLVADSPPHAPLLQPIALLANPFADQAIFISAIAFLDERTSLSHASNQRRAPNGLGMTAPGGDASSGGGGGMGDGLKTPTSQRLLKSFADSKLDVSIAALRNIISHWAGVGWVLRTIDQKKRGFSLDEMDPDLDADTPCVSRCLGFCALTSR